VVGDAVRLVAGAQGVEPQAGNRGGADLAGEGGRLVRGDVEVLVAMAQTRLHAAV
jgi:hypothetical protein